MAADDYNIISKHGKTTTASAVSPNSIKRPKERVPAKPDMPEVNRVIICQLCSGYLINATAITECQHTFCKSCILKYLETSTYCPVCDVQLNKGKPQLSLRSDVIIQRLVYKLVPGLLVSEIRRRREFSIKKGIDPTEAAVLASNSIAEEIETATDLPTVLTLDDVVSLSIEYYRSSTGDKASPEDPVAPTKVTDTNGKHPQQSTTPASKITTASSATTQSSQNQQQQKSISSGDAGSTASANASSDGKSNNENSNEQVNDRRYLQCPAAVSVGLLKKFIRMKYGLSDDYRVDLLYNGDRDSILENNLTLVDVAFIFDWKNKEEPMNIHYRIFERPVKSVTVYSGMKRPAPSVMDEPPDDDTASGPHNRSSMFSSSSAPSSKLPRLADNTGASGNQGSVRNSNTSGKSTTTSTTTTSSSTSASATSGGSSTKPVASLSSNNCSASSGGVAASSVTSAPTIKLEKEDVEEDEDVDDDDEDEDEDYELVERKEHMKGIKSSRRLHNSIKESMKRSVAIANSNHSLRTHHASSSSSRSHSNDTKGIHESERESARNENSLNSSTNSGSSSKRFSNKKRGKSHDSQKGKTGKVESLRLRVSSTSSSSSSEHNNSDGSDNHQHHHQPLKLSISTSGVTPAVVSSSGIEKKEPLKLSLGSVLANKTGSKSPERKHHKHKHHHHHHHHKLRHRDKQGKGVTPSATVTNNSQKPLKLSFTLSPPSVASSQNQSQKLKASQEPSAVEGKQNQQQPPNNTSSSSGKGKPLAGMQNYNNSARTSASAHGHLNNISKSISVSVNTNANNSSGNNSSTNAIPSATNSGNKGNQQQQQQYGTKISPAELIPKNTGIEIQPTTIPISSSSQISQHQQQHSAMQSGSSASGNNNSHKHSHPLLPDSVHVPKSVTLIPVNPNQMSGNNSSIANAGQMGKVNNNAGMASSNSGNTSHEKVSSGSQGNQNRINAHTFTHPITNKSLHQITVTEVPPPQQKSSNAVVVTTTNTTHSSISVSTSNPIEKVIANAANNKPQFNGPGSMEITKIYCGTASSSKENPAKKLKDRKGLDISITGTGFNVSVNKPTQNKLEEALRQKVNIAIGGGSGSISVTPAAPPTNNMSLLGQGMSGNSGANSANTGNKMKSVSSAAANLLSGKMPPGITIGPATMPPTTVSASVNSGNNSGNNVSTGGNNNLTNSSAIAGNNIMKGLGFTLPPHLTAHPHNPNNIKISHSNPTNNSQAKSDKMNMPTNTLNTNNSRIMGKDSISIIGKGNVTVGQQQQPPPVEITISATGGPGGKSQASISNNRGGISIVNKSKMSNDHLASIFDITQGLQRKSPSPIINPTNPTTTTKDMKGMQSASQQQQQQQQANKNANMTNKRPFDVVSLGGAGAQGNNSNKKLVKESPEQKRSRSASITSEPDKNKQQGGNSSSSTGEIPLDLSGRSTRTTPPITIPHPHKESSKSPSEKPRKSPERAEKPGIVITPSTPTTVTPNMKIPATPANSALSSNNKMNVSHQKSSTVPGVGASPSEPFKGQSKSISVSKLSPNQSSKIGSIVDSLAQKQAQAQQQQQQLQNLKNSQNQQHKQHQSHFHPHSTPANVSSTKLASPNNSSGNNSGPAMKSSLGGSNNSSSATKGSPSSSGLTSPINASPGIPMTSPSPPSTGGTGDHLRNLWTLPDSANRQGKLNQMNELLVAASLFSPTGHPHSLTGAAHQLAAAAAAAVAASGSPAGAPTGSGGSGGAPSAFNSNILAAQFGHHLAALGAANKIPPGMFDSHFMAAALNAHSAHAAHAAGMRMHHPFVGSMSPPLNLPNAFFPPHGAPGAPPSQQQQQSSLSAAASGIKIPSVSSKQGSSPGGNSTVPSGKSPNSMQFSPLFSHSVPVSSPKSPSLAPSSSSISVKSPNTGSVLPFTSASSMPGSTSISSHTSGGSTQHESKHSHSHISGSGKSSHHHHHHDSSSTHSTSSQAAAGGGSGSKNVKINGTVSTAAMPVFPPGIHNPLLPSRSSSSSNSSSSSGHGFQSGLSSAAATKTALNKSFSALSKNLGSSSSAAASSSTKGAIPNSMKISNFLPNKPKDSQSDANAEATITSGFGIMPPLQAKPNFSLSPSCSPPNNLIPPSVSIPKNLPHSFGNKESGSPISPVKGVAGVGANNNKPSSMTCASLLRPDSLYQKHHHPTHHLLNSLSPTKGDHHLQQQQQQQQQHYGMSTSSRLSGRAPSSDAVLLSTNKSTSPGASTSNKSHNASTKDGFSRSTDMAAHHHGSKSLSPTKEIITSKKEIGSIPTGPAALAALPGLGNRNFTSASSSSGVGGTIARPIPTIPAFLNRSSAGTSNPCTQSLHNTPLSKDGLQQKSTSPAKMSNEHQQQQQRSHLPSPVFFPFPGVSVPVQVKLQDEDDAALPVVTSNVTNTTSLSASLSSSAASTHGISLKPEVDKLLAAKEEKMEEKRKRSCSVDQAPVAAAASNASPKSFSTSPETERQIKSDLASPAKQHENENSASEIPAPPAKIQKIEIHADAPSSVKNEKLSTALISENKQSSESSSNVVEKGVKSESELVAQRESEVGEGKKIEKASNEEKGDAVVVAGADPSKVFPCTTTAPSPALLTPTTTSPCKTEAKSPSPVKASELSVEKLSDSVSKQPTPLPPAPAAIVASQSETQTNERASTIESADSGIVRVNTTEEEKSITQIGLDTNIPRKSDETSLEIEANSQESKSPVEIPKDQTESGQLSNTGNAEEKACEGDNEDLDVDVDVEMDTVADENPMSLGQSETINFPRETSVDSTVVSTEAGETEMNVDVDTRNGEENMEDEPAAAEEKESIFVEERVTLTKAADDEDVDIDVVDVGVDEPMEINTTEMRVESEKEDVEDLCIDIDNDTSAVITSNHDDDNERNAMEIVQNDEASPENELIESQPENNNSSVPTTCLNDDDVNNVVDDDKDMGNSSEEKKDVEEEEEKESKDPVEISPDVIKRQRVEETDTTAATTTVSQAQVASSPSQVEQAAATSIETLETQERNEFQGESTFLAVNEASNFSQDDSECGDLVIDLGPNAGENEVVADDDDDDHDDHEAGAEDDENNEKEAEELLTQEESNQSAVVQLEIKESCEEDATCDSPAVHVKYAEEALDGKANEEEPALSIIMNSEANEANQGEETHVEKSPAGEEKQDEDIGTASQTLMMMTEESAEPTTQQVAHAFESLNQDSIPNQITINPGPIEVNGVIKTDVDSESSEKSEKMPEDVAECPQVLMLEKNVHDLTAQRESSQEERGTLVVPSGNFAAPEEDNKNSCIALAFAPAEEENSVCGVMVESNSQLEEASPVNDTTAGDNTTAADNNEPSSAAVDDKKIEEEQQLKQEQCEDGEEQELSTEVAMLPESVASVASPVTAEQNEEFTDPTAASEAIVEAVSGIENDDKTAPVHFPEQDDNVESSENISERDDSSVDVQQQCNNISTLPATHYDNAVEVDLGTPMEVEENEQVDNCEPMCVDALPVEEQTVTETSTLLSDSKIDDDSMQIETDCSASEINDQISPEMNVTTITAPTSADGVRVSEEIVNSTAAAAADEVAVISATITTTSACTNDAENSALTPTSSSSSVAIKVDIAANDSDAGKNAAASFLPSSMNAAATVTTTNSSSSSLIIPCSNSSSGPSSSSASSSSVSVDVPNTTTTTTTTGLTGIGSKSLETFGKVAAGLLASATSTINNNNNNTSLAPTSCDAISIATTNANA